MEFRCAVEKLFFIGWLCISQKSRSFSQPKHCLFEQAILLSSNDANFRNRHRKFAPSHNLLSTKERRCSFYLRSNSLRCNAGTSHRFKAFSPPYCAKSRVRHVPSENSAIIFSDRALNRRSQDGVVSLKHGRLAHVRSQFSLFRRSPTHKNLPLATFCTSEHAFWLLFARRKK